MRGNSLIELLEKWNAIWRSYMMYKETMGFVKGIGAGIVASVAVAAVGSQMMKNNRHLRRDAHRAMQDRKSTRLNSSHEIPSRMPSSA